MQKELSAFNKSLFWDTKIDSLDIKRHARFIITRVVSRGNRLDWIALKTFYTKKQIREEVLQIRYLDKKTLNFLSSYFVVEKAKFRCLD